jgi:hypothetical protein
MSISSNPTRPNQGNSPGSGSGMSSTMEKAADKAKEAAAGIGERVSDAASFVTEKAKAATSSVMHSAEDAASYVGKKTDDGIHAVGSSLKSFGDTVRHTAPQRDMLKDGMCAVADTLENTGKYLEEGGVAEMAKDLTGVIKRNPIASLCIGIGVGFLLARALTPRSL